MQVDDVDLFKFLIVGLVVHAREGFRYPYPDPLMFALNHLASRALKWQKSHSQTMMLPPDMFGKLQVFTEPLAAWWPGDLALLPPAIDPYLPLLHAPFIDEQALDEQVLPFLEEVELPRYGSSLQRLQAAMVQEPITDLLAWARQSADQRGAEYVTVRRFLIEHPWVTQDELDLLSSSLLYFDRRLLGRMYEPLQQIDHIVRHDNSYWLCPHCKGILSWQDGQPQCAKRVCGQRYRGYVGMQVLRPQTGLFRLTWGIHTRVCVPGLTELDLYRWLQAYEPQLNVSLWPGVDRYDLRVQFASGDCWAVDVKDYESPESLGWHIHRHLLQPYPSHQQLHWDHVFYVVPAYRSAFVADYLPRLRATLDTAFGVNIPANMAAMHHEQFQREVEIALARQP